MKKRLSALGYVFCGNEPTKITVDAKAYGYRGDGLGAILEEKGVICEFFDPDFVVMMLSCLNGEEDLTKIEEVLREIPKREKINALPPKFSLPQRAMPPSKAMMGEGKLLPVEECIGKVLASTRVGCPPAVPIVVCGEIIDSAAVECFKYYGVARCMVL